MAKEVIQKNALDRLHRQYFALDAEFKELNKKFRTLQDRKTMKEMLDIHTKMEELKKILMIEK